MRKISIKKLYSSLSKEMQDLPFEVTKNGKHVAYMVKSLDNTSIEMDTPIKGLDNTRVTKPYPKKSLDNTIVFKPYSKAQQVGKK